MPINAYLTSAAERSQRVPGTRKGSTHYLHPDVARREKVMGYFTALFASRLPKEIKDVAFCGPASFRDHESDDAWHVFMIRRNIFLCLAKEFFGLIINLSRGVKQFILASFGCYTVVVRKGADILGIAPALICRLQNGSVLTSYCSVEDANRISWLIFDDSRKDLEGYPVSRGEIVRMCFAMLYCWFRTSFSRNAIRNLGCDWEIASILTLRWILSLEWVNKWILGLKIRTSLQTIKPSSVYCVHEMHPHARIAWAEARRQNIYTMAFQHASISRAKLFYFPTLAEIQAGLGLPDEICVFSEADKELLEPFYPINTRYRLGCGPRFSHWKSATPIAADKRDQREGSVLFAGSLGRWDNEVVLRGVEKLLHGPKRNRSIMVRLHPNAVVTKLWKRWLANKAHEGKVLVSDGNLREAIARSDLVVGVGTTVLEESLLVGVPSVAIADERYLSHSTGIVPTVSFAEFNWEFVEHVIEFEKYERQMLIRQSGEALGIDRPVFNMVADRNRSR